MPLPLGPARRYGDGVLWMGRPPYLRWSLSVVIVLAALLVEAHDPPTELRPFARDEISPGDAITASVEWRDVPAGLLPPVETTAAVAGSPIAAGEPILPSALTPVRSVPDDWWAVPVALPASADVGTAVRLVLLDPPASVDGIVVAAGGTDAYSLADAGLVAVPPSMAEAVARAAAAGALTLLVGP